MSTWAWILCLSWKTAIGIPFTGSFLCHILVHFWIDKFSKIGAKIIILVSTSCRLFVLIIQSSKQPSYIWISIVSVSLHVPYVRDDRHLYHNRQVEENSIIQMVAKDCDLSNNDDFYSLKIRAHRFLVLIRNSQDAAAFSAFFFFFSDIWKWPYFTITLKLSIED